MQIDASLLQPPHITNPTQAIVSFWRWCQLITSQSEAEPFVSQSTKWNKPGDQQCLIIYQISNL